MRLDNFKAAQTILSNLESKRRGLQVLEKKAYVDESVEVSLETFTYVGIKAKDLVPLVKKDIEALVFQLHALGLEL